MRMIIQFATGRRVEALLLAASSNVMRVILDRGDTLELFREGDEWYSERGGAVEIEGMIAIAGIDATRFCSAFAPRVAAAGASGFEF